MVNMVIYSISIIITRLYLMIMGIILVILSKKWIDKIIDNRHIELDNEKYRIYMDISPNTVEEEIDKFIKDKLDQYMLENFIIQDIQFIKADEIEKMIKDLDKIVLLSMSDLYVFYCKLLTNISNEDDLIRFINDKVRNLVLAVVTEFNKPVE